MAISEFPAAKQKPRSEKTFMLRHVPVDVVSGGMTLLSWVGTLLLIGGGLFILSWAIQDTYHGLHGDMYRPTIGTVISGGVEWHSPDDSPDYYTLELTYDYVANDARHTGTKLAFSGSTGPTFDTREAAEAYLAQQYPPGREITVYYDPASPDQCSPYRFFPEEGAANLFPFSDIDGSRRRDSD